MKTYIVDAVRTHVGRYGGPLAEARPDDLAAVTLSSIVERSAIKASDVDEVILGAANQSGEDNRNIARMALLLAGFPAEVPGFTVNRLCASGLQAVASASDAIASGRADLIIAGTESSDGYTGTVPEQIAECLGLPVSRQTFHKDHQPWPNLSMQ